jgi:RimJ/RimL family protein N-acetyltransferase
MQWIEIIQEAENKPPSGQFPGFDHRLEFHHLSLRDSLKLTRALQASQEHLDSYLPFFDQREGKTVPKVQRWIFEMLEESFPAQHFVFTIGNELVGFSSILPISKNLREVQLRYLVFEGFTGRGIATAMARTLELYSFNVWGFDRIYIEMDSGNRASINVAQKLGYELGGTKDVSKLGSKGTGFWYSFVKERPEVIPDGVLQGRPIEDFI